MYGCGICGDDGDDDGMRMGMIDDDDDYRGKIIEFLMLGIMRGCKTTEHVPMSACFGMHNFDCAVRSYGLY